eukprot:CAMPEP_0202970364 /NCGR_PEP_ID=MMETSP1396-20130829/16318_1 /ASSEMBLY_ACC=CAM_ASM_000872 /TAXON_ID= /ORGANISM="Pseudokeronopsis sp., Strain Brazil" /LENGTH=72 /DNA_ID=CAMNT_0049698805 /DNA_START=283 /DNA_END=498 /DNA_ORIENTATION=-
MLMVRLTQLRDRIIELTSILGDQHFSGEKERILFLLNNRDYIFSSLKMLNLEKGVQDVVCMERWVGQHSEAF